MATLLSSLTDNQTALLGCLGAISVALLILGTSFYSTNPAKTQDRTSTELQVLELRRREQGRKAA